MSREIKKGFSGGQYKPLSAYDVGRIHENAFRILDEVGVRVELKEALDIFERGGAEVDRGEKIVRISSELVEEKVKSAPSKIVLGGREKENDLVLEGTRVHMGTGGAALNVIDIDSGEKRKGTLRDIADIAKLADALGNIHFFVRPCIAQDVPVDDLVVNQFYAGLSNTTKHVMSGCDNAEKVEEVVEIAELIAGGEVKDRPPLSFITCWMDSPLCFASGVTKALIEVAKKDLPVILSSAPIAGLTSPITLAGTLVQLHAEELSGIVFTQLVNPGAPVVYGGIPSMADMHNLRYIGGGIEFGMMNAAISQLSQSIGLPNYNSAGITDAAIPDIQAVYEKAHSICQCALSGSNLIHHAAGMLESLLTVDYGQYVIDNEIIGMAMRGVRGIEVNEDTEALDEIKRVGHGGNYLRSKHTRRHMRTEFFEPMLASREEREDKDKQGLRDIREFAKSKVKEVLDTHTPVEIDPEVDRRIRERFNIL